METHLAAFVRDTPAGREAEAILRRCVHCGFCTATCPTYLLTGDELDGPRGRIDLIKRLLETGAAGDTTRRHLDRCLYCRACESTCPSGVAYGRLLDIGRATLAGQAPRRGFGRLARAALRLLLPRPRVFALALAAGRRLRPLLPVRLRALVPERGRVGVRPEPRHARRVLLLEGCVQPALRPSITAATTRVLERLGISVVPAVQARGAGCCGALRLHLDDAEGARADARRTIDAWWPAIAAGAEAVVITASGCGVQVKDYGRLLADDPRYCAQAMRVAALACDASEVVAGESVALREQLEALAAGPQRTGLAAAVARVAWHSPCTLQHGQHIRGTVETLLQAAGFDLVPVADGHLCCGSAGSYSLLEPKLSLALRAARLTALTAGAPQLIASANIGCIAHLQAGSTVPVRHWIELLDDRLGQRAIAAGTAGLCNTRCAASRS
ncbi:MAG: glycolate oxidase subunit GlcF [Gammaproteobacteria bacterium]|nr:glycolate oxidase subunit GlcF [Gammaproteobacteria bacterium]